MSSPTLFFKSINPGADRTLLLIHGAMSSHHEWELVSQNPHLMAFHLLIPDLPAHGQSTSTSISFTIPNTAALMADLVAKHARNGKASIVGMSLGAYVAIYMAGKTPEIIGENGMFLSGCGQSWPQHGSWTMWAYGLFPFLRNSILSGIPKASCNWIFKKAGLDVNERLYEDMKARSTYQLAQSVMEALTEVGSSAANTEGWKVACESVQARACVVAGILEDREEECRLRGQQLRIGNSGSKAFKVEGKGHGWNLQDAELFALGIRSWMNYEPMPDGYDEIA
jgi:pimeloyl-ACP methyl ester carboxylesterase